MQQKTVNAQDNQDIPFEKLVQEIAPERFTDHHPLCQLIFTLEQASESAYSGGLAELNNYLSLNKKQEASFVLDAVYEGTSKFDMTLILNEGKSTLTGVCEYNTTIFSTGMITQFLQHFINLLDVVVEYPNLPLDELSIYSQTELKFIENSASKTQMDDEGVLLEDYLSNAGNEVQSVLKNTRAFVVDKEDNILPFNIKGELWLGGTSVTEGFHVRPVGLEAIVRENGKIKVLGQVGRFVKINHRYLNLDLLEEKIKQVTSIIHASVTVSGTKVEVSLASEESTERSTEAVYSAIKDDYFWLLDSLYLHFENTDFSANTSSVKSLLSAKSDTQPTTAVEIVISGIWKEILEIDEVSNDLNFFDCGGNSMNAFQVLNRVKNNFNLDVEINMLFKHPTLGEFAAYIETLEIIPLETITTEEDNLSEDLWSNDEYIASEGFPLSFGQEQLWFLYKLNPNSPLYNVPAIIPWNFLVDPILLNQALSEVIKRHQILRTLFKSENGSPIQYVIDASAIEVEVVDLALATQSVDHADWHAFAQETMNEASVKGFDLERGPTLKAILFQFGKHYSWLFVNMNHLLSDGMSHRIMIHELKSIYEALFNDKLPELPELKSQYTDFVLAQRKKMSGAYRAKLLRFWKSHLHQAIPLLQLPTKGLRPQKQSYVGNTRSFVLSDSASEKILQICKDQGATVFMFLLTVFKVVLNRYSQQADIIVGSPVSNRFKTDYEQLIGYFVNTTVIRTQVEQNLTFIQLLDRVKESTLATFAHQDLPIEVLISELKPERSYAYHSLFQVMFSHQELYSEVSNSAEESLETAHSEESFMTGTSKFDLSLSMGEANGKISGALEYCADLFEPEMIKEMVQNYLDSIHVIVMNPSVQLSELNVKSNYLVSYPEESTSIIRGFRINRKELEGALLLLPKIAAVSIQEYTDEGQQKLAAYIVLNQGDKWSDLMKSIKLPDYLIPAMFIEVTSIPRNINGTVNVEDLPKPDLNKNSNQTEYVAPKTMIQTTIATIWSDVLEESNIGIHDNFFDLGGASLTGVQILSRIRELYDLEISIFEFFEHPTIDEMANAVEKNTQMDAHSSFEKAKKIPNLTPQKRSGSIPLSFAQERLWFLDQFEPGTPFYNIVTILQFNEPLEVDLLAQTIHQLLVRHEPLRTTFAVENDRPTQVIHRPWEVELIIEDLRSIPFNQDREVRKAQICQTEFLQPFDLEIGPLFRYKVVQEEQQFTLVMTMHHVISDAWSMNILNREIKDCYQALKSGQSQVVNQLPVQYADFSLWQRRWMKGDALTKLVDFWKIKLEGAPALLELPISKPRPQFQTFSGSAIRLDLPVEILEDLRELSRKNNVTLFNTMLAAFKALLFRYTESTDILVGVPVANRSRSEIEGLIGFFTNTLVVRSQFNDDHSFNELLKVVKDNWVSVQEYAELPFEKLVESLQPTRSTSFNPIFQIMFSFQNADLVKNEEENEIIVESEILDVEHSISKFDLTLFAIEKENGMSLVAEFNTDLFENQAMKRMLRHFVNLLDGIRKNPLMKISQIPIMEEDERRTILESWNETATKNQTFGCIHHFFEQSVEKFPEHIAVIYGDAFLTYQALEERANQVAHSLQQSGLKTGGKVAVCTNPSLELPVLTLAVFKAGGVIVPLDKNYPVNRLEYMLQDSLSEVLLVDPEMAKMFTEWTGKMIVLDEEWQEQINHFPIDRPFTAVTEDDLLYVLYTSGSTGKPKGASMQHKSVSNLIQWQVESSGNRALRTLQFSPTSFDVSFQEIFSTWAVGATLVMIDIADKSDPIKCLELLQKHEIERLFLPFVALDQLANAVKITNTVPVNMKQLITAGEQLRITPEIKYWLAETPNCRLENQYGPVETHIVTSYVLDASTANWTALPPIGKPLSNVRTYIVDKHLNPVPIGVCGEVCIGGLQVATGYLNLPDKTSEKFVDDPFVQTDSKMYLTGDKARYLEDGNIDFIGRLDNQVKIRGFRIEPGEIESVLTTHDDVREAVVVFNGDSSADRKLMCYWIPANTSTEAPDLKAYLSNILPEYMVPKFFVGLEELPKTPSGKIDRLSLSKLQPPELSNHDDVEGPRTPLEKRLCSIWQEALGLTKVGIHDNFFELGGHSLLATKLIARISEEFGERLSVRVIFESATVAQLSIVIVTEKAKQCNEIEELLTAIEEGILQ